MRRNLLIIGSLILLMNVINGFAQGPATTPSSSSSGECLVYIGTRASEKSKGIYMCRLDTTTGKLTSPTIAAETTDPAFLAIHPNHHFLYAVGENARFAGTSNGTVSAFAIDLATGKLTLLNQQNSGGQGPCHLAVDASGQCVLAANYGSGSVAAFPIHADGSLGGVSAFMQHHGSASTQNDKPAHTPTKSDLTSPIAGHFALTSASTKSSFIKWTWKALRLHPTIRRTLRSLPALARAISPSVRMAAMFTSSMRWQTRSRLLIAMHRRALSKNYRPSPRSPPSLKAPTPQRRSSFIPVASSSMVRTAQTTASPFTQWIQQPARLRWSNTSRPLAKYPDLSGSIQPGNFLVAANQSSDNLVAFRIDPKTGRLKPTGQTLEVPSRVCVTFLPLP